MNEGDVISIDGSTGRVWLGEVPVEAPAVVRYFEGEIAPDSDDADDLVRSVHRILAHADEKRRLDVRTNADTPEDSARARRFGAQGIGLCRTEHMFLGDRRQLVETLILAENEDERNAALDQLEPLQKQDFLEIFEAMDGLPTTIRLLDPPLHEFLPDLTDLSVRVAIAEERGEQDEGTLRLLAAVQAMHEQNPMLGLRGVRLGLVVPGPVHHAGAGDRRGGGRAQEGRRRPAAGDHDPAGRRGAGAGGHPRGGREGARRGRRGRGRRRAATIGTMIEVPRAVLTAGEIAGAADFFSFGTNDLTQMTWGFSRDDVEAAFFHAYLDKGIFGVSPFESLDIPGVGRLIEIAVEGGRAARPDLKLGDLRRARRRPGLGALLPRGRAWTTSPARRSASRWRGWRPAARRSAGSARAASPSRPPCSRWRSAGRGAAGPASSMRVGGSVGKNSPKTAFISGKSARSATRIVVLTTPSSPLPAPRARRPGW